MNTPPSRIVNSTDDFRACDVPQFGGPQVNRERHLVFLDLKDLIRPQQTWGAAELVRPQE